VGTNPTFGDNPLTVEAHILDFDGRLVGMEAEFEFVQRLRDQRTFPSPDSLALAVAGDVEATRSVLATSR
jgi:riboflavin kinase/FMN adenylyltransferase